MSKPKTVIMVCDDTLAGKFLQEVLQQRIAFVISDFGFTLSKEDELDLFNIRTNTNVLCIVIINRPAVDNEAIQRAHNIMLYSYWRSVFESVPIIWCDETTEMFPYMFEWTKVYRLSMNPEVDEEIQVEHVRKYGQPVVYFDLLVNAVLKAALQTNCERQQEQVRILRFEHLTRRELRKYVLVQLPDREARIVEEHILICDRCASRVKRFAERRLQSNE